MVMVDANKIEDYILCTWGLGSGPNVKAQRFVRIKPPILNQICLQSHCEGIEGRWLHYCNAMHWKNSNSKLLAVALQEH